MEDLPRLRLRDGAACPGRRSKTAGLALRTPGLKPIVKIRPQSRLIRRPEGAAGPKDDPRSVFGSLGRRSVFGSLGRRGGMAAVVIEA
jgi:hypothetical protein